MRKAHRAALVDIYAILVIEAALRGDRLTLISYDEHFARDVMAVVHTKVHLLVDDIEDVLR